MLPYDWLKCLVKVSYLIYLLFGNISKKILITLGPGKKIFFWILDHFPPWKSKKISKKANNKLLHIMLTTQTWCQMPITSCWWNSRGPWGYPPVHKNMFCLELLKINSWERKTTPLKSDKNHFFKSSLSIWDFLTFLWLVKVF